MTWRVRLDGDMWDMRQGQRWQWTERSGGVASWGERLTYISAELTDVKRVVVIVAVFSVLSQGAETRVWYAALFWCADG